MQVLTPCAATLFLFCVCDKGQWKNPTPKSQTCHSGYKATLMFSYEGFLGAKLCEIGFYSSLRTVCYKDLPCSP